MEKINLSSEDYLKYKTNGITDKESHLFVKDLDTLYRFYKNTYKYDEKKVEQLISMQEQIKNTTLPLGSIYVDDIFVGTVLKYFKDYKVLYLFKDLPVEVLIPILKQIGIKLQELTDNNLYLTDLDDKSILVSFKKQIELINTDSLSSIISSKKDPALLNLVLNLYKNIVLEYLYPDYDPVINKFIAASYLENQGLKYSMIDDIINKKISYELINEIIDCSDKNKIYLKK